MKEKKVALFNPQREIGKAQVTADDVFWRIVSDHFCDLYIIANIHN